MKNHPFHFSFTTCFKMRVISEMLRSVDKRDMLEMGCGSAYSLAYLKQRFPKEHCRYTGVDVSEEALAAARPWVDSDSRLIVGDVTRLPFPNESFDDVMILDVLEHVADDRAAVAEAYRVLKPGGRFIVSTPNRRAPLTDTFFCEYMHDTGAMKNERAGYGEDELVTLIGESGFHCDQRAFTNVFLSELMITATKLGYRLLRSDYKHQGEVISLSETPLFRFHQAVTFPIGYALGRLEEKLLGPIMHGHCLIVMARKPN